MAITKQKQTTHVPSWVLSQMLACPDSRYGWDFGVHPEGTRRARALHALMRRNDIDAHLRRDDTYAPGLWKLDFPVRDYRLANALSDRCEVGLGLHPKAAR